MAYIIVASFAAQHGASERTIRNYCAQGKIPGAFLNGKTWNIPEGAPMPSRKANAGDLLARLKAEMEAGVHGGIYHRTQIDLTYNSNHIEGSRLTHEQTRMIFETHTLHVDNATVRVDDVVETANHFVCVRYIIQHAKERLTEKMIKQLHQMLKQGTSDSMKDWFRVGDYKLLPNEVGGIETCPPEKVHDAMVTLLSQYYQHRPITLDDIIAFHQRFEEIHPFQDGNGRVGRLIMFKECLAHRIVPFIIDEDLRYFYYRGLHEWSHEHGYLTDTCLAAQDKYKQVMDYFKVKY